MFANRFVVVVDACSLFGALSRDTLLSLAEADLFRIRWTEKIVDETEKALDRSFSKRGDTSAASNAKKQRTRMHKAFEEATVIVEECHMPPFESLPDPDDSHVIGAAVACDASMIVTENIKDFPEDVLRPFGLEAKRADSFIADTIDLRPAQSIKALATMRRKYKNPELTAEKLLLLYESREFYETADLLRPYIDQL